MASRGDPVLPCLDAMEPERQPPALVSELLEEIFLRVASPADLARASAACVSFRRIIADHSFLRRYRSIHPPLLLGFVRFSGFHRVEAPHPNAAVARAVARAADFSFDYLPRPTTKWHKWEPSDVRNGRVILECCTKKGSVDRDLVVCDPLSRRYLLLPPITDASVELQNQKLVQSGASFIPSGGPLGGMEEDTSFSVIRWMQSKTRLGVFVFSSVSGCWSIGMHTTCDIQGMNGVVWPCQCAYDCFYWKLYKMSTLIKLDVNTMQFHTIDLPPGFDERLIVIVESGESKIGMLDLNYKGTSVDYYTLSRNGSENSHEWHMMSTTALPTDFDFHCFWGPVEGYMFLQGTSIGQHHTMFLSIEIKSLKIERISTTKFSFSGRPYFGFPPSMSPIRIQGCGEE